MSVMTSELPNTVAYDPTAAQYHLTLRYNPLLTPTLPRIGPDDILSSNPAPYSPETLKGMIEESMCATFGKTSANAKVAIALSGGVDSTLMLAMLRRCFPDLEIVAITVKFDNAYDETEPAARTAKSLDVDHTVINVGEYMRDLPAAIHAVSLPMWDLHWYTVAREAHLQSADVLVSGDGGDELFGGYTFRYRKFLQVIRDDDTPEQKIRAYLDNHIRDYVDNQEAVFGPRMNFSWDNIHNKLRPYFDNHLDPLKQVFLADYNGKLLYNFSQISSALSSHFGIKTVAPLLSPRIIRYAMQISPDQKYDTMGNTGKLPLRAILGLLRADHMVSDSKAGFSPNTASYWSKHGYETCASYLDNEAAKTVRDGWISREWISNHLHRDETDIRIINKFLGLLAFEVWYRIFITKEMDPETKLD